MPENMVLSKETIACIFLVWSLVGSALNTMLVSAFYEETSFQSTDFLFLGLMITSDLIMTVGVFLTWTLSMVINSAYVNATCHVGYMLAVTSVYCFSFFSMFASMGQFFVLMNRVATGKIFNANRMAIITTVVVISSILCAYVGTMKDLDPDICALGNKGNSSFRIVTAAIFIMGPCLINIAFQVASIVKIFKNIGKPHYKRSRLYKNDRIQLTINILSFVTFIVMWSPYTLNLLLCNDLNNDVYLYAAIGMARSVFGSIFFLIRKKISEVFSLIMHYTFCKRNIYKRHRRHRRGPNYRTPGENASVYLRPMVIHDPVMHNTGIAITEV